MAPILPFRSSSLYFNLIFLVICRGISGATFTFINRCDYIVWPGILSSAGSTPLDSTGFELTPGQSQSFQAPSGWSGRFWGRTGCIFDPNTGQGTCATGDCGSYQVQCNGAGATPPATLAEFTIGSSTSSSTMDFYDVSLVDGYNLPIAVEAKGGSGACGSTGCVSDLNRSCPTELRVGEGQACKSACEAFGNPEYCCSGEFSSPDTCKPSVYSEIFKSACPRSYSYAYDDATSTFTCTGADYLITFCPSSTSQSKSSRDSSTSIASGTTTPITTTSTNAFPTFTGTSYGSGSEAHENPTATDGSWFPNFVVGDSTRPTSNIPFQFILIATTLIFYFFSFVDHHHFRSLNANSKIMN